MFFFKTIVPANTITSKNTVIPANAVIAMNTVIPAKAGIHKEHHNKTKWILASAGITNLGIVVNI
ncbi:hypothetical protein [Lacinutrix sp. Bg11-31]|uniref:hypothetical protein n=1 Tax=Lacinutrix sp. Bg11-31 TaxID=2057808 RepID=UPI0012FE27A9|nr:hypothetical protein [Lacinutrix sp. Bg11-31]